jgi:Holliday junction resolvase RusA-like endonuclease
MGDQMLKFTIPIAPITKKNHQQIMFNRATGKPFVMPSKEYREYEHEAIWYLPRATEETRFAKNLNIKATFYMPTRRKCDLTNLLEALDDVLVKSGLLADDNYTIIAGHDGSRVQYDKENLRTEVIIERMNDEQTTRD